MKLVPSGVVTLTSTVVPTVPAGLVVEITPSPFTPKQDPGAGGPHGEIVVGPKATCVAPLNPLPRICTLTPPVAEPLWGLNPATTGVPTGS
jgi:hypothetical protein